MSGYVFAMAPCIGCKAPFSFNPHKVPSMRVTPDSPREPVCETCFDAINAARKARDLPLFTRHPDAYEVMEESEL